MPTLGISSDSMAPHNRRNVCLEVINQTQEVQIVLQHRQVILYPTMPQPDKQNAFLAHTNGTQAKRIVWIHLLDNILQSPALRQLRIVIQVHTNQTQVNHRV
tara:strand:+ start:287 stop:592 length:306 start_codon:yes stop_codon:yes gene_type:complete